MYKYGEDSCGADFKEKDIIVYCDEEYIVLQNNGYSGTVKENYENGDIINNFKWEAYGEKCIKKIV